MTKKKWDFGIQKELRMVDDKLREMVKSQEPVLTEASLHVIEAGGKRMRPAVMILAYKSIGGTDIPKIVDIAAGFELIHSATLVHDDINDGGMMRRGRETVFKKYGLHDAVVTGDFLFAKAFQLGGTFDRTVVETTADACAKLAEGEIMQHRYRHRTDLSVDTYLQIMDRKTAQPIRAGAMVGAYLAGATPAQIQGLGNYGLNLGIAFQIVDDILDFTGDEKKIGKPVGMDLKEGHLTLPSLLAAKSSESARKTILEVVASRDPSPEVVSECVRFVVSSGAIERARELGEYYGMEALRHLGCLSNNEYSKTLRDLVNRVLTRDS
ncbi:MAG: polyprenyl synthetase family protein [Thermoplasmata archaeon]